VRWAGFGINWFDINQHNGVHHKIPQIGRVVIEDDVEIGPNCSIERGALDETRIGKGTKIDGLVVFGHGSTIGPHGILVAQTGIAGSVTMGHHVVTAGQVGIAGHLKIGDMVQIAAQSGVMADVEDNAILIGTPAMSALHARRVHVHHRHLRALAGKSERPRTPHPRGCRRHDPDLPGQTHRSSFGPQREAQILYRKRVKRYHHAVGSRPEARGPGKPSRGLWHTPAMAMQGDPR
jgi:serine acetyltransferase